jgi:hypothetical protein
MPVHRRADGASRDGTADWTEHDWQKWSARLGVVDS